PRKLAANLAHDEIRIIHREDPSDYFRTYTWDGRLFLINGGGSHHFAAAKYIAKRLHIEVPITGKLLVKSINNIEIQSLCNEFDMFVANDESEMMNGFREVMRLYQATWLSLFMPRPF